MDPLTLAGGAFFLWLAQRETTPSQGVSGVVSSAVIQHAERANGVNQRLLDFLAWWKRNGAFDLLIAPDGGLRIGPDAAAKQLSYYNAGNSNAKTLQETPHGRGAALDLWPVGFNPSIPIDINSPMSLNFKGRFYSMGIAAERFGLIWGGRWTRPYDLPHIQVPNWTALPYPPQVNNG